MSQIPSIRRIEDLRFYTGSPWLPDGAREQLEAEGHRRKGGRQRNIISGVSLRRSKKETVAPVWRVEIGPSMGSEAKGKRPHRRFVCEAHSLEEAAYVAAMAHRVLKPWYHQRSVGRGRSLVRVLPGDASYFWNNIWGLWRYALVTGEDETRFIAGAWVGSERTFITDFKDNIYRSLAAAPFFHKPRIGKKPNFEPVTPSVELVDDDGVSAARVRWLGLTEVVLGRSLDPFPDELEQTGDFREEVLRLDQPPFSFPTGWELAVMPWKFNALNPAPGMERLHVYWK